MAKIQRKKRTRSSQIHTEKSPRPLGIAGSKRLRTNLDLLLAAAVAVVFAAPLLFTAEYFVGSGTDMISMEYPLHAFAGRWLEKGVLPLWNPFVFGGVPFQSGVHGYLYPGFLSAAFLDTAWDIKLSIALHLVLAAVGGAWLARCRCRHIAPRVLLGTAYGLSAFTALHLFAGHRVLLTTAAYLPWVTGAALRALNRERRALWTGIALAGLMFLSGHYQIIFIGAMGIFLWLLLERCLNAQGPLRPKDAGAPIAVFAAFLFGGALIAAVQLIPAVSNVGLSQRPGDNAAFAASFSASPSSLLCYLLPNAYGNRVDAPFAGDFAYWESIGYFGIAPLFFAIMGAVVLPVKRFLPSAAVIVVATVLSLGAHTPIFDIYLKWIPAADLFRSPGRFVVLVTLFGAVAAAEVLDQLIEGNLEGFRRRLAIPFAALILVTGCGVCVGALRTPNPNATEPALRRLISNDVTWAVVLIAACAALTWLMVRRPRLAPLLVAFVALITFIDILHFGQRFLITGPPERFGFPASIEQLLKERKAPGDRLIAPPESRFMNYPGLLDLGTPGGYDIFVNRDFATYLNLSQHRPENRFVSMERIRTYSPLVRLLGVRFFLSTTPLRGGRTQAARGYDAFRLVEAVGGMYLYEDPSPVPRAALVHNIRIVPDKESQTRLLSSPAFDFKRLALLDAPLPEGFTPPAKTTSSSVETVKIVSLTPNRVEIHATAETAAVLVFSDSPTPGWSATVDGKDVPMVRADRVMRALPCPPGRHTIVFEYLPVAFVLGAIVSVLSLIGLAFTAIYSGHHPSKQPSGQGTASPP